MRVHVCVCVMRARLIMHTVRQAHNHTFNTFFFFIIYTWLHSHMLYACRADNASERCIGEKRKTEINKPTYTYEEKKASKLHAGVGQHGCDRTRWLMWTRAFMRFSIVLVLYLYARDDMWWIMKSNGTARSQRKIHFCANVQNMDTIASLWWNLF